MALWPLSEDLQKEAINGGWGVLSEEAFNFHKTMIIQIMALLEVYSQRFYFPGIFNYYVYKCIPVLLY